MLFWQDRKQAKNPSVLLHKNCNSQGAITRVGSTIWKPSSLGIFKLNTNVSTGGVRRDFGWVFPESVGAFVAGVVKPWEGFCSAQEGELLCIRETLSWVFMHGCTTI
ncbi:unnamed protein product [Cuscuta epithymum]|uniref:Uncharacterized protein n=1 Tax=Cuscuta epithymum TaxID=186058 RepID=A0AAV0DVX3_9ASTE|nr:unnamed protein product [Cuscuta epithymum]